MKKKLIISFIITLFLLLMLGVFSITKMIQLSDLTQDLYDHPLSVTNSTKTIQSNIISMHRYMKDVVLSRNKEQRDYALEQINKSEIIVYKEFESVFERYLGDKNDIQTSYQVFVNWKPIRNQILKLVHLGEVTTAADLTKSIGANHVKMLNTQVSKLVFNTQKKAASFLNNSLKIKQEAIILTSIILVIILLIITFIFFLLIENLNKSQKDTKKQHTILLQQSRLAQMGEMLSMIAHQWRQPLASISATSIDLQMNIQLGTFDLKKEHSRNNCMIYFNDSLIVIDRLVNNLTTTIDDFRNFYKTTKVSINTNIKLPIIKAFDVIRKSLESDNILIIENYNTTKKVEIYFNEFMQVILNMLKNAQDNFKEKEIIRPIIKISCVDTIDGVSITIEDNGGGINKEILMKIFDPYFSTKNQKNGTGLGLYMSKIIIDEHHNGKLSVDSYKGYTYFNILMKNQINSKT